MPQILLLLKSSKNGRVIYFDKAIASDSCDSDSEDEGRKKFWIFTDDAPVDNENLIVSSEDKLELNYILSGKNLEGLTKVIRKAKGNSTTYNQSKIKFNVDAQGEDQFESGFGSLIPYNSFYLYILLFCIIF